MPFKRGHLHYFVTVAFGWLARLTPSGALDTGFGEGGILNLQEGEGGGSLQPLPGGFALVGSTGSETHAGIAVWGFNNNGTRNPSFGAGGSFQVPLHPGGYPLGDVLATVDAADRILIVSSETTPSTGGERLLVRINPDGTLDSSFGQNGEIHEPPAGSVVSVAIDPQQRILLAGWAEAPYVSGEDALIERLIPQSVPQSTHAAPSGSSRLARIKALLASQIYPHGHHATVPWILHKRGWTLSLSLGAAGKLRVDWWARQGKHARKLLLAYGQATIGPSGRRRLRIRLSKAGRRFLRAHKRGMQATASAVFALAPHTDVDALRQFKLP